jgi:hypothetical protein
MGVMEMALLVPPNQLQKLCNAPRIAEKEFTTTGRIAESSRSVFTLIPLVLTGAIAKVLHARALQFLLMPALKGVRTEPMQQSEFLSHCD